MAGAAATSRRGKAPVCQTVARCAIPLFFLFVIEDRVPVPATGIATAFANLAALRLLARASIRSAIVAGLELIARPRRGDVDRRRRDRPRLTLEQADRWRDALIAWAQGEKLVGFLFVVAICAAAAWLVRRFSPQALGSGIPQATASLNLNHGKRFKFD